jgi:DNA-binding protein H-NS
MALNRKTMKIEPNPKNTRQGEGRNTKYAATSRNTAKKVYRGQGR